MCPFPFPIPRYSSSLIPIPRRLSSQTSRISIPFSPIPQYPSSLITIPLHSSSLINISRYSSSQSSRDPYPSSLFPYHPVPQFPIPSYPSFLSFRTVAARPHFPTCWQSTVSYPLAVSSSIPVDCPTSPPVVRPQFPIR